MSTPVRRSLWVLAALGAASSCDVPPVAPTSDAAQNVQYSRIEGDAVVAGPARGNLIIFRFDATRPPPPAGTGRPEAFTVITKKDLYGDAPAGAAGPFTAPYAFSLVPPGAYLLRGFLDVENGFCPGAGGTACRVSDFNPWYGVTGEPNRGDIGGAAVDAATLAFQTITIAKDPDGKATEAATGVTFSVQQSVSTTVPADRPVFMINTQTTPSQQFSIGQAPACNGSVPAVGPRCKVVDVVNTQVYGGNVDQRAPAFLVRFIDQNNDCVADDLNGDGQPDFWPRVFVRKQADTNNPALLTDENDWDHDGVVDTTYPSFVQTPPTYTHADWTTDTTPDAVLLAAGLKPDSGVLATLVDGSTGLPKCQMVNGVATWPVAPVNSLQLVVQSVALDVAIPTQPVVLRGVPLGRYSMTLMQFTGQTWRMPNELQPLVAAGAGLPEVSSQAWYLDVVN